MYAVTVDGKTFYADKLQYARQINGAWIRSLPDNAQALFIAGQLCNFKGKTKIEGLPYAAINNVDAGEVLADLLTRLKVVVENLENAQEALCDLSIDVEGAIEGLCDLSLEVEGNV